MAVSTVSTVNMYLLNKSGPYVPPPPSEPTLRQSGMIFPNSFTGLSTILGNIFTPNARHVFSSNMSGTSWRDVANGYCSSYYAGTPAGVLTYWSVNEAFSGDISSGSQRFWFPSQHVQP
jgi:hypothetical protein